MPRMYMISFCSTILGAWRTWWPSSIKYVFWERFGRLWSILCLGMQLRMLQQSRITSSRGQWHIFDLRGINRRHLFTHMRGESILFSYLIPSKYKMILDTILICYNLNLDTNWFLIQSAARCNLILKQSDFEMQSDSDIQSEYRYDLILK